MSQLSFSDVEFGAKRKQTRRDKFLAEIDEVVAWARLTGLIEPVYPKGKGGRPPYALETMLRVHFMQQWFALSSRPWKKCSTTCCDASVCSSVVNPWRHS